MALYEKLSENEWEKKIEFFAKKFSPCSLCPRECGAERSENKKGVCKALADVKIASYNLHFGEEPPISGIKGSGTVFFSGCTLKCVFCQNYPISHLCNGEFYSIDELANIFLYLQKKGAHNINLVSPTPYLYHFVKALYIAYKKGLRIPIVYNTSGYEKKEIVKKLKGLVDIYMPDFKYFSNKLSLKYSGVNNYFENAFNSIKEMFEQMQELEIDKYGVAIKGVLIRHLILPGNIEDSKKVLKTISDSSFKKSYLSLLSQYFPAYKAASVIDYSNINRRITIDEYNEVKEYAVSLGFSQGWFQDV